MVNFDIESLFTKVPVNEELTNNNQRKTGTRWHYTRKKIINC